MFGSKLRVFAGRHAAAAFLSLCLSAGLAPAAAAALTEDPPPPDNGGGIPKFPPGLPKLPDGSPWQEVTTTDPEAQCSRGTPYAYFIHEGDPQKLIINFTGGGACSNAEGCDAENPTFFPDLGITRLLIGADNGLGIFAESRADNPVKGWTHFVIPNCTGDLNLGGRDVVYTRKDGTTFPLKHRGAINTKAALAWLQARYQQNHSAPTQVIVVGSSAGAYASIVWTPAVQEMFPTVPVRQFADCGAGVTDPASNGATFPPEWGIAASLPAWVPGLDPSKDDVLHLTTEHIYSLETQHYPRVEFTQFNYNHDQIQTYFYQAGGADPKTWTPRLYDSLQRLRSLPNFHDYLADGTGHAILVQRELYDVTTAGDSFTAWFDDLLNGRPLRNVVAPP